MPTFALEAGAHLHYLVDDFTDPWTTPETIVLLHGNCESGLAWYAWVPLLARRFRVVRPDMRGYGASTPMPRDFAWSLDVIIDDYARLMDALGVARFHLVGAKIGGIIARAFAARRPDRVKTLTVVGSPPPLRKGAENIPALTREFETLGVEHWARRTMAGRLGDRFPAEGVEWWIRFMGLAPVSTLVAAVRVRHAPTVYARFGDWFAWLCAIATAALLGWLIVARGIGGPLAVGPPSSRRMGWTGAGSH